MTVEEIINLTWGFLDDEKEPHLWKLPEMVAYFNRAQNDVFRETNLAVDFSTAEICQLNVLSGVALYALDTRVLTVQSAKLSSQTIPLGITFADELDRYVHDWQNKTGTPSHYIPEAEPGKILLYRFYDTTGVVTGLGNISFEAATKKITKPSGLSVYSVGDRISISGTASNNTVVTVVSVLDAELVVSEALIDEAGTSAVLRKVRDTLKLRVTRLPLNQISPSNLKVSPELHFQYHDKFPDGIMKYAYLKVDTETYNPKKAADHAGIFGEFIKELKEELLKRTRRYDSTARPLSGAI